LGGVFSAPLSFLAFFALDCFVLFSLAQAVVPAPDGGYPGFNTAEGHNALLSLTSGTYNTAVGAFSLGSNTDGSYNTAVGAGTLLLNIGNENAGEGLQKHSDWCSSSSHQQHWVRQHGDWNVGTLQQH
jgi:hypothetical protein